MSDKIFPQGITCFAKSDKAPDFVLGTVVIDLAKFKAWVNGEGIEHLSDYKGSKQLRLQMLAGKDGRPYVVVDNYKPSNKKTDEAF